MKNKTILITLITVFILSTFLIMSRDEKTHVATATAARQISFYHYFSGALSGGIGEMINMVNKGQQDYNVSAHALDHEAFKSMIYSTLSKSNPPELLSYWAGAKVQELVDMGKLEAIDDLWEKASFDNIFPKPISEAACTYNGKKYLLPITQHVVVFFYNKSIFEQANLTPPRSWEEFTAICGTLRGMDIIPIALGARERWPAQFWLDYMLLYSFGPSYRTDLMSGRASYIDQEVRSVYKTWAELLQLKYFNSNANELDWVEATEMVKKGGAAMTLMGTWAIPLLSDEDETISSKQTFDFFPFPIMNEKIEKVAVGPIDGIVLTRDSDNHEFAKSVLTYFSQKDPQQKMSLGSGALAPSKEVKPDFYSPLKQRILKEIEETPYWAFNYDLATSPDVAEKGMDSFNELIEFPDQHQAILENLQAEVKDLLSKKPPKKTKVIQ